MTVKRESKNQKRKKTRRPNWTLKNPIARKVVKHASHRAVVEELRSGTVDDQTGRLDELVRHNMLPKNRLAQAIMDKAPYEMDKAIRKFRKDGKEVSVDTLCADIRNQKGFQQMCANVGVSVEWFEDLAKARMEAAGYEV